MSSKILKIGQISDIHIGNGEELVQGIDVCANFRKALYSKSMQNLDLLVLSGDLSENSEPGAYEYVASLLKDCKSPYCINWTVRGKTPVTAVTKSRLKRGLFSSSIQVETTYLGGDVYELKRIRCMSCGEVFKI